MNRRSFIQYAADAAVVPFAAGLASAATNYQVGAGMSSDPYTATQRAVTASGQWPAMSGKTVMIKPNLVNAKPSTSGATTDPQVVRALVDMALDSGASQIIIAEGGVGLPPANFDACGYNFFNTYNARVQLMDFLNEPVSLVRISNGLVYFGLYLPTPAIAPGLVFISAGKLKTHINAFASLSMKNLFGLPSPSKYQMAGQPLRLNGHQRGIDLSIVDVNLARPTSFSVIDGIWGMEGNGPLSGTPVQTNMVFAGLNAVATDRVALDFMKIPQHAVPHLSYASAKGLGPADTSTTTVLGDSYTPVAFTPAQTAPIVWRPTVAPNPVVTSGAKVTIYMNFSTACVASVDIIQDNDVTPNLKTIRSVQAWKNVPAGASSVTWDLKDNNGAVVAPGPYLARVMTTANNRVNFASSWMVVQA